MPAAKPFNPFYPLLVVAGLAFAITACAYAVMTVKMLQPAGAAEIREATTGLLFFLDRYGLTLLLSELGVLAVFTFAAIGTDDYWIRRSLSTSEPAKSEDPKPETGRGWRAECEVSQSDRTRQYRLFRQSTALRFRDVLDLWERDSTFRTFFSGLLAEAPFDAFRWETPPVTATSLDQPFEFVLVDSPDLDRPVQREAFAEHFPASSTPAVVSFANLGQDATLVVPSPIADDAAYGHLAAFVRRAPAEQQHLLWQTVAKTLQTRIGERPVWLSTAGGGVAWLHVRLDDHPKYYSHEPYAQGSRQ